MRIGIDLGTSNMSAFIESKQTIIYEPSVVALDSYNGKIVAVGTDALKMIGRAPESVKVLHPIRDGVVFNYDITVKMLEFFINKICANSILKPDIMLSVPCTMTSLERMAVLDAFSEAGAGRICMIEEPMAASLGAEIKSDKPMGTMVVDFGGGSVDIAIVTMGDIAVSRSFKDGSDNLTGDIIKYLRRERDIDVGKLTAEKIKYKIGGAINRSEEVALIANGKNAIKGSPLCFEVTSTEIYYAIHDRIENIMSDILNVFSITPPELTADIFETGILLTGNGSRLYGLDTYIFNKTGVKAVVADEPEFCVIKGIGMALKDLNYLQKNGYFFKSREI